MSDTHIKELHMLEKHMQNMIITGINTICQENQFSQKVVDSLMTAIGSPIAYLINYVKEYHEPAIRMMVDNTNILTVTKEGLIQWYDQGKMRTVETDKDLARVFMLVIQKAHGKDYKDIIQDIINDYEAKKNKKE